MSDQKFLDLSGDVDRLNAFERKLAPKAPIRKSRDGDKVRVARIPVPDVCREIFPEAFAGIR